MLLLSLQDQLDILAGTPFGIYEAESKPANTNPPDDDESVELGLDRRLGISKSWQRYSNNIDYIMRTRNRSRVLGLDQEFSNIIANTLGPSRVGEISENNPITFEEASRLALALYNFDSVLNKRSEDIKSALGAISDPEVQAAVDLLKSEMKKKYTSPTLMQLLNPLEIKPGAIDLRYQEADGHITTHYLGASKDVPYQATLVATALEHNLKAAKAAKADQWAAKYKELQDKFMATYAARLKILQYVWPEVDDRQRKHTAAYYTVRHIAELFNTVNIAYADWQKTSRSIKK